MAKTFYLNGLTPSPSNQGTWSNSIVGDVASSSVLARAGGRDSDIALQIIDVAGNLEDSFGVSVRINTNFAAYQAGRSLSNAAIVYDYNETDGSYKAAVLRSGGGLWRFQTSDGTNLSNSTLSLPLHNSEVRGDFDVATTAIGSSEVLLDIPSHNCTVGDVIRLSAGNNSNFVFHGLTLVSMEGYVVSEIVSDSKVKIQVNQAATFTGSFTGMPGRSYYQFDQHVSLLFDRMDSGEYKVRFYDQRQGILLLTTTQSIDMNNKFGILANNANSYFKNLRVDSEVATDLFDALSSIPGFSVTIPDNEIGVPDFDALFDRESAFYTVIENNSENGVLSIDGANLVEGDILSGLEMISYNMALDVDNVATFIVADSAGNSFDVVFDGVVSRLVSNVRAEASEESRIAALEMAGVAGPAGAQGAMGIAGVAGATGAMGPQGPAGPTGAQGAAGAMGAQGAAGPAGADGARGPQGVAGAQGTAGANGADGAQGVAGANGADGAMGMAGVNGMDGATGAQGVAGADGQRGAAGAQGATGAIGATGATGERGAIGATGAAGSNGIMGQDGAQGLQGIQGLLGDQGVQGIQGETGARGPMGMQGAAGIQGPQGDQGIMGAAGDDFNGHARLLVVEADLACVQGKLDQLLSQLNAANLLSGNGTNFSVNCE